jgi:hypothetical protein
MEPPPYQAGDIFSFRTSPATEFSPKETGRYAAIKVLGFKDGCVCFVVLNGIFDHPPDLARTSNLPWLKNIRFVFRGDPACRCTPLDWKCDLEDLRYVGTVELSREDLGLLAECGTYGLWSGASHDAEGEWRWQNDRTSYQDEVERDRQIRDARSAAQRERYEKRLKTLTWEKLLEEQPFSRWNIHPPFPPAEFVDAARDRIRLAIHDLQALGSKPKKRQVRAILKACVEWFNEKGAEFGNVIETEEREDICSALEDLASVACHRSLIREIDEWRDW